MDGHQFNLQIEDQYFTSAWRGKVYVEGNRNSLLSNTYLNIIVNLLNKPIRVISRFYNGKIRWASVTNRKTAWDLIIKNFFHFFNMPMSPLQLYLNIFQKYQSKESDITPSPTKVGIQRKHRLTSKHVQYMGQWLLLWNETYCTV